MSAIFGLVRFDGAPVSRQQVESMAEAIQYWGPVGRSIALAADAALGQLVSSVLPEWRNDRGAVVLPDQTLFVAAGRLDNRDELSRDLSCASDDADSTIIAAAWQRWRDDAPRHLYGDWSFAAWDPIAKRLFVARDAFGNSALYYHRGRDFVAFASSRKALFAIPDVPRRLNELRLAQHLAFWATDGAATLHEEIDRMPPGFHGTFGSAATEIKQFWFPERSPEVKLESDEAYVDRFLDLYSQAVRVRLRTTGPVTTTLSSGLDSGSINALAIRELRKRGESLTAFTSVPLYRDAIRLMPKIVVDEWPLAHQTAEWLGIEHRQVMAEETTPLAAIERSLWLHDEPEFAAGNLHWIISMMELARAKGSRLLLTGQLGNAAVSWTGDQLRPIRGLLTGHWIDGWRGLRQYQSQQKISFARAVWSQIAKPLRLKWMSRRFRRGLIGPPFASGFIAPAFAARLRVFERMRESGYDPYYGKPVDARAQRFRTLLPGVNPVGAIWAENGAGYDMDVRDPTGDVRLLEFCLGVPERLFANATHDRLLMRRAMEDLLPPSVQWNRPRGRQGADLLFRLRADAANVDAAVLRVIASPAARAYLNIGALRDSWTRIRSATGQSNLEESLQFARLLMFGIFLSRA